MAILKRKYTYGIKKLVNSNTCHGQCKEGIKDENLFLSRR